MVRGGETEGGNDRERQEGFLSIYLRFLWTVFQVPWSSLIMSLYLSLFLFLCLSHTHTHTHT